MGAVNQSLEVQADVDLMKEIEKDAADSNLLEQERKDRQEGLEAALRDAAKKATNDNATKAKIAGETRQDVFPKYRSWVAGNKSAPWPFPKPQPQTPRTGGSGSGGPGTGGPS